MENIENTVEQVKVEPQETADNSPSSSLGKFKDAETLYTAYQALETEFTKKCQEMSRLQAIESKELQEQAWSKKTQDLEELLPLAKRYREEIKKEIDQDESIRNDEHCLELAFLRVLAKQPQTEELLENEEFLDRHVYSNDKIKGKILESYVRSLDVGSVPRTISLGGERTAAPPKKPTSVIEAGQMAEKLFNNRRIK